MDIKMEEDRSQEKNNSQLLDSVMPGSTEYWSTNKYSQASFYRGRIESGFGRDVYMRDNTYSSAQLGECMNISVSI